MRRNPRNNTMFPLDPILAALLACALMAQAIRAQDTPKETPEPVMTADARAIPALRVIDEQLERNDAAGAIESLKQLAAEKELSPMIRHAVNIRLGMLTGMFRERQAAWLDRKVLDTVVLVDDEMSLLVAIAGWTDESFYPVLLDDGWYSRMFIEAFKPARIVRFHADGERDAPAIERALTGLIQRHLQQLVARISRTKIQAPGIVVIDPKSPLRVAGLALAIGHAQPIVMLGLDKDEKDKLPEQNVVEINTRIFDAMSQWRVLRLDSWCAMTLAAPLPFRYAPAKPEQNEKENEDPDHPPAPPPPASRFSKDPMAVDDLLGRDTQGTRFAVTGRLTGPAEQAIYQAMSALFIQPSRAMLVDGYALRNEPTWAAYDLSNARTLLAVRFPVDLLETREKLNPASFRAATRPINPYGLLIINSSGGSTRWSMGISKGNTDDMPIGTPLAVHMTHSFSASNPYDPNILAGRCLLGGAYWYFGSMSEPYLHAFVRPTGLVHRALAGTPLAFAARHPPGHPLYAPWRLMLIGDPLFALRDIPAQRLDQPLTLPDVKVVPYAEPTLDDPKNLSPGDLARAAWRAVNEGRSEELTRIDPAIMNRHPYSRILQRDAVISSLLRKLDDGQVDDATALLELASRLGDNGETMLNVYQRYLVESVKIGRREVAMSQLKKIAASNSLPYASRAALKKLLSE